MKEQLRLIHVRSIALHCDCRGGAPKKPRCEWRAGLGYGSGPVSLPSVRRPIVSCSGRFLPAHLVPGGTGRTGTLALLAYLPTRRHKVRPEWTCRPSSTPETPRRRPPTMAPVAGASTTPGGRHMSLRPRRQEEPEVVGPRPVVSVQVPRGRWTPTSRGYCESTPAAAAKAIAVIWMHKSGALEGGDTRQQHPREGEVLLRRPPPPETIMSVVAA